jgi:hypothetical protein
MFVIQDLVNVFILLFLAQPPIAKLENAIQRLVANQLLGIAMMELLVLLILAVKIVDATMLLTMQFVTTTILAPLIDAISN